MIRGKRRHDCFCNVASWECERCGYLRCYCYTHREFSTDHCRCRQEPTTHKRDDCREQEDSMRDRLLSRDDSRDGRHPDDTNAVCRQCGDVAYHYVRHGFYQCRCGNSWGDGTRGE